jgi:hypothetical protein
MCHARFLSLAHGWKIPRNVAVNSPVTTAVACAEKASTCVVARFYHNKRGDGQGVLLTGPS